MAARGRHHARMDARSFGEDRASAFERAIAPHAARTGNACCRLFSGAAYRPLSIATQNSRPPASSALAPARRQRRVQVRSARGLRRHEGRDGRGPAKGANHARA